MCLLPGGSEWRDIEPLQHRPQVLFHQQRRQPHCLQLLQRHVSPPVSPPVHWEKEAFYQRLKDRNDVARSGTGPHSGWDGTTFRVGRYYVQGGDGTTFRVITVLHSGWERVSGHKSGWRDGRVTLWRCARNQVAGLLDTARTGACVMAHPHCPGTAEHLLRDFLTFYGRI